MSGYQASNVTSAMALTEEDLSAILVANHPSQGLMSMSLTNAMISSNTIDLLSGQLPYSSQQRAHSIGGPGSMDMNMNMSMQGGGLERPSMSSMGSLGSEVSSSMSQASLWPLTSDEKWDLDGKNEVLDPAAMRSNVENFGGRMEVPLQSLNPLSRTQGLQRYHSAPSSFLQCLADVSDEAFLHNNSPGALGNSNESGRDDHLNFFNEDLAPIMESAPSRWTKQPVPEKVVARSNPMNSTEQYFAIQAENARQAALRESSMPSENLKSLSRSTLGLGGGRPGLGCGASSTSDFRSRALNSNLLRQSSSPAELLAAINEREDLTTSMQQQIRSQDDNLSGITFGSFSGKRVRFPEEMTDDSDLLAEDGYQQNLRGERTSSLMRHQSLPMNTSLLDSSGVDMGYDDLLDLYAPCKTRARRGYATHPRSIAERNRRSRISERMKKLQELVPNMDKQTNTADMLDEAVEYVKHLQLQVKDLSATIVQLKSGIRQQTAG